MKKRILWLSSAFIISSFAHAQVMTSPPSYSENQKNPLDIYRAEAERINNLVHTKLDLKFDYNKEQVLGEEWVTLKPHFYATSNVVLDAKAMIIHEVALVNGNSKKKLNYKYDDLQLNIDLGKEYKKDQEYTLYIKYTARPNEVKQEGSAAINDAKGVYFINPRGEQANYPTQIWTQGETESSSCWFPTIDKTNQKTSEEITLTYPDKYVSLSNGLLKSTKKNSDGTKTDYWKFDKKHAPYLFFFGIGDYAIIKDKWKNIDVDYYVEPAYKDVAKQIFGNTPEMIQFFSDKLGYAYPWEKYSQMTAREYVSGAMENTTATLFHDGVQQKAGQLVDENTAEYVVAHELFHHWFGDLVTAESWGNLTVNESFANYSEYLWFEHKYGKEKADEHRYDEMAGYKHGDGPTKNLVRVHYNSREDMFDGVSYNKGGLILHMLRNFLGDEAFFKGLSKYLKDNEYGKAEAAQLRIALEEVSGRDLNWFFNQWYFDNGHPKLTTVSEYNPTTKKVKVTVKQDPAKLFEFPFAIDVVVNGKTTRQQVWVAKQADNAFEFDASKKPDVVIPNADQVLLADIDDKKPVEDFIAQYKAGKGNYTTRVLAINAMADAQATNPKAAEALIEALNDPYDGLRIYAIHKLDLESKTIVDKAEKKLKELAANDPKTLVQAAALNALNEANIYDEAIFEKASKSPSFSVQGAALTGIIKKNPSKIDELTKNVDDLVIKNSRDLVAALAPTWIKNNQLDKAPLLAEEAALYEFIKFQDPEKGKVAEQAFNWIMTTDSPEATAKVAKILSQYYSYLKEQNPQAGVALKNTAEKGVQLKTDFSKTKKSATLVKQVEELQAALSKMK
ncbi:M1 family metallopeptidase [Chishuiella sp.]|uniref:M1 family metallopeptidase n=1 Tax=Chishuiella sp. TaxID=1969467 RepID=UPI0028AD42A1|nr:M1 family metallopeptidase [Chishuiella sp.]